ncbi:MAG: hypothetical protein CMI17_01555 [Opitutaceae bacterium]|nr:hypothetical protein [Opitutaceae bacterium]HBI31416.1 hypothetical protein [Verrucomicrobiales bacterium]|tara:strand:+ start:7629 stop:8120 length:492 start_codon:yes stop_codon:yes gene_type:complete
MKGGFFTVLALSVCGIITPLALAEDLTLSLSDLSAFEYQPEVPESGDKVVRGDKAYLMSFLPEEVYKLDKKSISITGYMMPIKSDGQVVQEFLLVANTMACCYGVMPSYNEFIYVKMSGPGALAVDNVPITLHGRLSIEETWENGFFSHLYAVRGQKVEIGKF